MSCLAAPARNRSHPSPHALFPMTRRVKHSLVDEQVKSKLPADAVAKVEEEVESALRWVQTNQVGARDEEGGGGLLPKHPYCPPPTRSYHILTASC